MESGKKCLIIANKTCITYKEVFPFIIQGKIWSGRTGWSGGMWFETKNPDDVDRVIDGMNMKNVASVWLTNMDHGRRHEPLRLMSEKDNLRYNRHKSIREFGYRHYVNYDAIEVPYTDAIPSDYPGIMGVPLSFLEKHNPEQFEIVGMCENENLYGLRTRKFTTAECKAAYLAKFGKPGTYDLNASGVIEVDGLLEKVFQRILIRKR